MEQPQFAIIITTFNRPDLVRRSVASVQAQSNPYWQLLIVIDDTESSYTDLLQLSSSEPRIKCLENKNNTGKNASVNRALDLLTTKSFVGYIIFLDDDDWLDEQCLADFASIINRTPDQPWLVSNRNNFQTGAPYTNNNTGRTQIYYPTDVLLFRRFWGDATHCLKFSAVQNLRFPTTIKNAEEWLYFCAVSRTVGTFLYTNSTGTWSDGYTASGLTQTKQTIKARFVRNKLVWGELQKQSLYTIPIVTYFILRCLKSLWK